MESAPSASPCVLRLDLADLSSVAGFVERFSQSFDRLDVLLNNAGVMGVPQGLTADGFETQLGVNHLGHFALTGHLLPLLERTPGSRVVTVSSSAHRAGVLDFDDLHFADGRRYTPMRAYGQSKLANLLFAYELQRRFDQFEVGCRSVAAHPGAAQTQLGRHIEKGRLMRLFSPLLRRVVRGPEGAAQSQLRACVDPEVRGGEYWGPDGLFGMSGDPARVTSSRASLSTSDAARLWKVSESLTGIQWLSRRSDGPGLQREVSS